MKMIRVLLAEDHETVRQGLRALLADRADIEVVGEARNGRVAVDRVCALKPDVAVLDLSMPEMSGLAATREIKERVPHVAVIAMTRHTDDAYVQELLSAGASGYVVKQSPVEELLKAIRAVATGERYLDASLVARNAKAYLSRYATTHSRPPISDREAERPAADGHRPQQQGNRLRARHRRQDGRSAQGERDAQARPARPHRRRQVRGAQRLAAGALRP